MIRLNLNLKNLKKIIEDVLADTSIYSHSEIAEWCSTYVQFCDKFEYGNLPIYLKVAEDIDSEWEIFLLNNYSLEELQNINLQKINMPREWFKEWNQTLELSCS